MNPVKHCSVTYVTKKSQAQQYINTQDFKSVRKIRDELYEVTSSKSTVHVDLPIKPGFTILQIAKLRMLEFYYDFLQANCRPQSFQLCEMDTDSFYMAFSGENIESIILNDKIRTEFTDKLRKTNCNANPYGPDQGHFFPRECCPKHAEYDSRTPGLFKLEATGIEMVSLCSKTYSLKQADGSCKFSSKGLNKRALTDPHSVFKQVLETGTSQSGINRGIVCVKDRVVSYEQKRNAISYFYCKREVQADDRSTKPLKTVLKMWPTQNIEIVDEKHPLHPDRIINIVIGRVRYETLFDVCQAANKLDDPVSLVSEAFKLIEPWTTEKDLVFVAEGKFRRRHRAKNLCMYWTSGMNRRASELLPISQYPGINKLGEAWIFSKTG